jgi:hypothetical protein
MWNPPNMCANLSDNQFNAAKAVARPTRTISPSRKAQVSSRRRVYTDGPTPYFRFPPLGGPSNLGAQWLAIKSAALDAMISQRLALGELSHNAGSYRPAVRFS